MKYLIIIIAFSTSFNLFAQPSTFMTYVLDVSTDVDQCEIQALGGSTYSNPGKVESIKDGIITLRITPDRYYLVKINDSLDFLVDGAEHYKSMKAANPDFEAANNLEVL